MAQLALTEPELALMKVIGPRRFLQARSQVTSGQVEIEMVNGTEIYGFADPDGAVWDVVAECTPDEIRGFCECPDDDCTHSEALILARMGASTPLIVRDLPSDWELALGPLLQPARAPSATRQLGLQLEVMPESDGIRVRPVLLSDSGRWVRQGITWSALGAHNWNLRAADPVHVGLLTEFSQMANADNLSHWSQPNHHDFEGISNRRVWDLLAEAQDAGVALVQPGHPAPPVTLHRDPIAVAADVGPRDTGLDVTLTLLDAAGSALPLERVLLGRPAHGVAWLEAQVAEPAKKGKAKPMLHLAALDRRLDAATHELLRRGSVTVPAAGKDRFLLDYLPALRRQVPVRAADIELPTLADPLLRLTVRRISADRLGLTWEFVYPLGAGERTAELDAPDQAWRNPALEAELTARVMELDLPEPMINDPIGVRRLAARTAMGGVTAAVFITELLPRLEKLDGVETRIDMSDGAPEYRRSEAAPVVTIGSQASDGSRDWFDLAVSVTVDGEEVPFDQLFRALAQDEQFLLLPSGTYFALNRDEFARLATLIAEARAMDDARRPEGTIRLSRYQAGLWEDLDSLGVLKGQASDWKDSVLALRNATDAVPQPPPAGLNAVLRAYQLAGFNWLAALHQYGLGGVLADDMGLGKTLQAVALMLHVRAAQPQGAPFLVVAPTSVAGNWISEIERFAPSLTAVAISQTQVRRGAGLAEAIAGADVVITTYTLLRLEQEQYCALDWAGMLLDEAQMAKNHQAQTYAAARALPAPFKLAITGTPMENNLMELWSLLSITAPGLFPNATRFTEYYRTPIEKGKDAALLAQLRARIRPLMLRRTKDEVATDLPDKQEQVLAITLNPQHEKGYQLLLNRERQRILGLLGDLNSNRFEIFRSLTMLRQASLDLRLVDAKKYAKVSPTKLDELVQLVEEIAREGHRTLIFSQFTRFLGEARQRIEAMGVDCCYLDGKTRNRATVVESFRTGTAPVFLISLKAGGFGLNLPEADYCILLDPWWNPATEAQAVDRVHRIGQTQKVMVYRLVSTGTIEEKVMALKQEKAALFSSVMDGGAFESATLTADEIRGLLDPE